MKLLILCARALMLVVILLMTKCKQAESYDPLDPNGKMTVTFDIYQWTDDGYTARVTIQNLYQYRHVGKPGWNLGWTWTKGEVIWSMAGAVATQEGDCSNFKSWIPHSCKSDPVIVDLSPNAASENRTAGCCRGGLLAAQAIDPSNSLSSFDIVVGNISDEGTAYSPHNLTLLAPNVGYTCSLLVEEPPTVMKVVGGKREVQAFRTWKSACTYSAFVANMTPSCCVSLSTFYNPVVTSCMACACGCEGISWNTDGNSPLCTRDRETRLRSQEFQPQISFGCTGHMCPVRVHWHVKSNYKDYWRVKMTVSNYRLGYNYSDWNLVVQHPGFSQPTLTYSFNSTKLLTPGNMDDATIFWGLQYLNDHLSSGNIEEPGSVTTDVLLSKDQDSFTLRNGWAFPRKIYFNGENCEMPMPTSYPGLPNMASIRVNSHGVLFFLLPLLIFL